MRKLSALCAILISASAIAATAPSAQDILAGVRLQQATQSVDLEGQLRQDALIVPFRLTQNGATIRYRFTNPDEALQLRLGDSDSRLE
ncbi:MAG: hypothetical protein M3Y03_05770, partial [Verrucomicrobiota bacterium]|nr:hypothetical protein [Verrucomicrobiota bacterium]